MHLQVKKIECRYFWYAPPGKILQVLIATQSQGKPLILQVLFFFKKLDFIVRKKQKIRQALHEIFFKPQYKCASNSGPTKWQKNNKNNSNPSGISSRIPPLIFLKTFAGVILSPKSLLNFPWNLYVPPWFGKFSSLWCSDY